MRVLVFHGYLLRGTGSNIFNANLAAAFLRLGHEVDLLCQERHASELEFVGAVGDWDSGSLKVEPVRDLPCTVYRPNIGQILPVYVEDSYEALTARLFPQLSDAELDAYIDANVEAVADVVARARPDVALANHLIMGPAILARALAGTGIPYAVLIHGSALEYTVKPYPRFLPYAQEGLAPARGVLAGSRHTAESLWATMADPELPARTGLGPPGVDVHRFRPLPEADAVARARELATDLGREPVSDTAASTFSRDRDRASRAVSRLAEAPDDPLVTFVGKLIVSKGIDLLLTAWPLVLAEVPSARLGVIGFGAYADASERLVHALATGDLRAVRALAREGRGAEGGPPAPLEFLTAFLDRLESSGRRAGYVQAATGMQEAVTFTGRLEHEELADVLPLCEAIVVPSTFPEAFGMVAAEGAACGVLPISAAHSGLAEVSHRLAESLPPSVAELVSFPLNEFAVESIAGSVLGWLNTGDAVRERARAQLVKTVAAHYSWEQAGRRAIAAAEGRVERLD